MVRIVRTPEGFQDILEEGDQYCIAFTDSQDVPEQPTTEKQIKLREPEPTIPVEVVNKGQSLI